MCLVCGTVVCSHSYCCQVNVSYPIHFIRRPYAPEQIRDSAFFITQDFLKVLSLQAELDGQSVGACTNHANKCGCGIGLFLRLIVLLFPSIQDLPNYSRYYLLISFSGPGFDDAFAEWENARLWCFPGEPKAVLNLLPISIRWEESQPFSNRIYSPFFLDGCAFSNVILVKLFWYHKLSSSMERLMKVWGEGTHLHCVLTGKWISLCWVLEDIYLEVVNVFILWIQVCKVASALAQSRNRRESDSQHWGCFW